MNDEVSVKENDSSIQIILNGSALMTFDKSKFSDRDSAISVSTDMIALFNVAAAAGEALGIYKFVDELPNVNFTKEELRSRAKHQLESKFGDSISINTNV
ncbi:hypothetical protein NMS01_003523 [Vibrio cholerae]|nr:hypothetical protein [Vibrio cholerae]